MTERRARYKLTHRNGDAGLAFDDKEEALREAVARKCRVTEWFEDGIFDTGRYRGDTWDCVTKGVCEVYMQKRLI